MGDTDELTRPEQEDAGFTCDLTVPGAGDDAVEDGVEKLGSLQPVSGGIGLNLDYWNIRTVFEINYKRSLDSATRPNVQQNELASFGEVNDEVFLRDLNVSLGFVFPFRFINSSLKAY